MSSSCQSFLLRSPAEFIVSLLRPPPFSFISQFPGGLSLASDRGDKVHIFVLEEHVFRSTLLPDGSLVAIGLIWPDSASRPSPLPLGPRLCFSRPRPFAFRFGFSGSTCAGRSGREEAGDRRVKPLQSLLMMRASRDAQNEHPPDKRQFVAYAPLCTKLVRG